MKTEDRYLNEIEAAAYLGLSPHTLRDWRSKRCQTGPRYSKFARRVRYKLSDLDTYMIRHRVEVAA